MEFDIDVSGEDIFNADYTIVVADKNNIIFGYKFDRKTIQIILSKYGQGLYTKYKEISKSKKATFKIRLYCIIIYFIFKCIYEKNKKLEPKITLNICKDFYGKTNDIESNLKYFLEILLNVKIIQFNHMKLPNNSNAHHYAYLLRKDFKNKYPNYIKIDLKNIEEFLIK